MRSATPPARQTLGPRHLEHARLRGREISGLRLAQVLGGVNEEDVLVPGRLRGQEVTGVGQAFGHQGLPHEPVLARREDVGAQVDVEGVVVDELEGQHRPGL